MEYALKSIDDILNTANEVLLTETVDRNFKKLLENDIALDKLREQLIAAGNKIYSWASTESYSKGQLVWYKCKNALGKQMLHILQSMHDDNSTEPKQYKLNDGTWSFEPSGWKDKNSYATAVDNGITEYVTSKMIAKVNAFHEFDSDMHYFGKLDGNKLQNESKLLLKDASNIDQERHMMFYPYVTTHLDQDSVIMNGICRKWDNGILEYDITFKLGYAGYEMRSGASYQVLSCNTFEVSDEDAAANSQYFMNDDARKIFTYVGSQPDEAVIEGMILKNRGKYVNTYSGTIAFPTPFKDTNYMMFHSDVRCQERDTRKLTIDAGCCTMTYANKKRDLITALYVMFSDSLHDARTNGLVVDSFSCHVIGRWK